MMWPGYREVSSSLSVAVHVPEDEGSVLLLHDSEKNARFPSTPLKPDDSWRLAAKDLAKEVTGFEMTGLKLLRLVRVWRPDAGPSLFHILYEVQLSKIAKSKVKLKQKGKLAWFKWVEVTQMWKEQSLYSPEVWAFLPGKKTDEDANLFLNPSVYSSTSEDSTIELNKEHIVGPNKIFINSNEQLVTSVFNDEHVSSLYRDYLVHNFPYVLMGKSNFIKYLATFGVTQDFSEKLFRATDLIGKGGVTFRELLYTLAALDPNANYSITALEGRASFVFRYYDQDRNGSLDSKEFQSLVEAIKNSKGKDGEVTDKEMEKAYFELNMARNSMIQFSQFLTAVAELRIKGVRGILKCQTSATDYIDSPAKKLQLAMNLSKPQSSGPINFGSKMRSTGGGSGDKQIWDKDTVLASHTIKVGSRGVTEIGSIDRMLGGMSTSFTRLASGLIRQPSVELFKSDSAANEVLLGLNFFAQSIQSDKRTSIKNKPQFDWGNVNFHSFTHFLLSVCHSVVDVLKGEPRLLKISSPVYLIGDVHGNFRDVRCMEKCLWPLGVHITPGSLLWLGDYVDRGPMGLEVVAYIFALKVNNPNTVFLLRGNHEIRSIQKLFTFEKECLKRAGPQLGAELWEAVNKAFDHMPLAAVIDGTIFAAHGGIPPPWLAPTVAVIDKIPCPLVNPEEESPLAWELMWNDPAKPEFANEGTVTEMNLNEGFAVNKRRGTGHIFNFAALERFLTANSLAMLIRAHEAQKFGYQIQQKGKVLTVFSSSNYIGKNQAALVLVQSGKARVLRLETDEYHEEYD